MILVREEDRAQAESKKKKLLVCYIAIAAIYVAVALLLLFLSPDRYLLFLLGDIAVTIAFAFSSIYFFSVEFDSALKRSRLLDKVLGALPEREYGVFIREEEGKTIEGVPMKILLFTIRDDVREVRCVNGDIAVKAGEKYLLELRGGVLVEIGEAE